MWTDNETDRDFLNFEGVAETIAEIIVRADGRPVSIGVSGAWGVGKSTMIKLTRAAIDARQADDESPGFIFVEFNAWLYQGYDDARAALLDVIATKLNAEAKRRGRGRKKARELARRVRWVRLAALLALPSAAIALGLPPVGLPKELADAFKDARDGIDADELERIGELGSSAAKAGPGLLKPPVATSPPKEIQALRASFEQTLAKLGVTLVVLIDDLDRCLPGTTISTLEAIRLFLFMENTAFVIAADEAMIKHAVRRHFEGLEDKDLVTNYFDKLIQIPIRVPALGIQEVRAYLMMLFVEDAHDLPDKSKDAIRKGIAAQLRQSWQGARVDRTFVATIEREIPPRLVARLTTAEQLAHLLTTAKGIAGNPRLIKRFLNALSIRMTIATSQGVGVDEAVLAKLLLFERCAQPAAYSELSIAVNSDPNGRPAFLRPWEAQTVSGEQLALPPSWDDGFIREWLALPPRLGDTDLRGALYVGREHAPLITSADRLSSEAAALLAALLQTPAEAAALKEELAALPHAELSTILDGLLTQARQEQEWGVPGILHACVAVVAADDALGSTFAGFLMDRPGTQITAAIVPRISDFAWALAVLAHWEESAAVSGPVKKAIKSRVKRESHGNVAKQ